MAGRTTVFLTPEETQRVTKKFEDGVKQCKTRAGQPWKAEDRKGLIQHATSTSLMQELSLASLGFGGAAEKKSDNSMMTYAVGAPYPPCTVDAKDLTPMKVAQDVVVGCGGRRRRGGGSCRGVGGVPPQAAPGQGLSRLWL
ncbi:hypothetical protein NLG97_g2577 [Lecanicillium saksenae]|uniref:Uncharacterized protein n=1 Tax=Lecanicillium saksenae TaxID=468837 RepID=A0ACC1R355_9HYPO|nr:hypothetical protein NLG97_g2577 [Lecanicillium saksenae]